MALTECTKHAEWTVSLLQQLDFEVDLPIDIYCDSLGARAIAANSVYHKHTKHIAICYHYIRDVISHGTVNIEAISTKNNIANILTKSLPRNCHESLVEKLGLVDG